MTKSSKKIALVRSFIMGLSGMILFAVSFNLLIQPLSFFSGGVIGFAQILRSLWVNVGLPDPAFDLSGILYYIINIPLFILAYRSIGKFFFVRTLIMTTVLTVLLTVVPIPVEPLIHDSLTAAIVAGVLTGMGTGLTLISGYSAGGMDILGLYFTRKYPNFSVGKIGILVNILVFGILALTQDFEIVVYSFIFNAVALVAMDKVHIQNINVWVMIFTKKEGVDDAIMKAMGRGVTNWDGAGAYTGDHTYIHSTMINKMERPMLRRLVLQVDPKAFIISTEGSQVFGNFQKRL